MSIKWDKKLEQRLHSTVVSYNRKVQSINKRYGSKIIDEISETQLKDQYLSRKELNRKLDSMGRLRANTAIVTNKGGASLTKYQWDEIQRGLTYAKSARTRRLKHEAEKPMNQYEYGLKTNRHEQIRESRRALDRYDLDYVSGDKLERLQTAIRSEENRALYTKNFYDEFFNRLVETQDYAKVDPILINDLKKKLQDLDPNGFLEMYNETPELKTIFESIETKGFRRQMEGYRGHKSKLAVDDEHFNGMLNELQQKLPAYLKKYA